MAAFPAWPQFDAKTDSKVLEILHSGKVNYWTGSEGMRFESQFAQWLGVRHAVSVLNGPVARRVAWLALGLDPDAPEGVIMVRHAHGEVADLAPALRQAKRCGRPLVEDCTECLGGLWKGRKAGSIGTVSFFSFGADDAFTTGGDGGMICTNDDDLAWELRSIRDQGYDVRAKIDLRKAGTSQVYIHRRLGYNFRLTEIQSAIGLCELARLGTWNLPRRRAVGAALLQVLVGHPLLGRAPIDTEVRRHAFPYVAFPLNAARMTCSASEFVSAVRMKGVPVRLVCDDAIAFPTHPVYKREHVRRMIGAFLSCASTVDRSRQ